MTEHATVFCYVRPWNSDQFTFLASELVPGAQVLRCSEHRKIDDSSIAANYYLNLKNPKSQQGFGSDNIGESELIDIIARCRLLRKLSKAEALRHVLAMGAAIDKALDAYRPKLILSITIDSYVMDLLRVLSLSKGIKFVSFIGTFANGYYRVSARGEANFNRNVDVSIIQDLRLKLLKDDYAPAFNVKSLSSPRKSVYRRWAANIARVPYFWAKRILSGEYYNYHYWVSQLVSAEQFHLLPPKDPGDANWVERLNLDKRLSIFIPLQMFPECTVDYWCQNVKAIDYYKVLNQLIDKLSTKFKVVIKEHPSVMGSRPSGFYACLSKDPRVIVVPTYTPSNQVIAKVDAVVVWTGSVGFESILRGKAVFGLGYPFYASGERFSLIQGEPDLDAMVEHIEKCKSVPVTSDEQDAMLSYLASQLLKGDFINDGSWNINNTRHVEQARMVVASYVLSESETAQ